MPLVSWSATLATGVEKIDAQHRDLIVLINELHDAMRGGRGKEVISRMLVGLKSYAGEHFATEEGMMASAGYPELAEHKFEHDAFIDKVLDFELAYKENSGALTMEVMLFLRDWLLRHIQGTDQKYAPHLRSKGIS